MGAHIGLIMFIGLVVFSMGIVTGGIHKYVTIDPNTAYTVVGLEELAIDVIINDDGTLGIIEEVQEVRDGVLSNKHHIYNTGLTEDDITVSMTVNDGGTIIPIDTDMYGHKGVKSTDYIEFNSEDIEGLQQENGVVTRYTYKADGVVGHTQDSTIIEREFGSGVDRPSKVTLTVQLPKGVKQGDEYGIELQGYAGYTATQDIKQTEESLTYTYTIPYLPKGQSIGLHLDIPNTKLGTTLTDTTGATMGGVQDKIERAIRYEFITYIVIVLAVIGLIILHIAQLNKRKKRWEAFNNQLPHSITDRPSKPGNLIVKKLYSGEYAVNYSDVISIIISLVGKGYLRIEDTDIGTESTFIHRLLGKDRIVTVYRTGKDPEGQEDIFGYERVFYDKVTTDTGITLTDIERKLNKGKRVRKGKSYRIVFRAIQKEILRDEYIKRNMSEIILKQFTYGFYGFMIVMSVLFTAYIGYSSVYKYLPILIMLLLFSMLLIIHSVSINYMKYEEFNTEKLTIESLKWTKYLNYISEIDKKGISSNDQPYQLLSDAAAYKLLGSVYKHIEVKGISQQTLRIFSRRTKIRYTLNQ